jgi:UDP-N-acetylmuramyl pentapeptide synthase
MAALDTLAELPGANKVAILGDMPDLGDNEEEAHRQVGDYAATRVHRLVTKGEAAQAIATQPPWNGKAGWANMPST